MMFINRKTLTRSAIALPAALALSPAAMAEPTDFVVDDEHFSMFFEIMHIGYAPVMGMFREVEGQFVYDEEARELKSGQLVFQSDSVFTNHKKRDDHVRNADFLDADEYPEITFTVTDFETTGENTGNLTGDLELLGQKRPVVLDVTLKGRTPFGPLTRQALPLLCRRWRSRTLPARENLPPETAPAWLRIRSLVPGHGKPVIPCPG